MIVFKLFVFLDITLSRFILISDFNSCICFGCFIYSITILCPNFKIVGQWSLHSKFHSFTWNYNTGTVHNTQRTNSVQLLFTRWKTKSNLEASLQYLQLLSNSSFLGMLGFVFVAHQYFFLFSSVLVYNWNLYSLNRVMTSILELYLFFSLSM